jgi:HK97 family phage major capsid protein
MTTVELRQKRAAAWDAAKKFLDTHRGENGLLSAEDSTTYDRMEADIVNLGNEVARQERMDNAAAEMGAVLHQPLVNAPGQTGEVKRGRASDEYKQAFWGQVRNREMRHDLRNALQLGTDSEGGYLAPDEFERRLIAALADQNIMRGLATVIQSDSGDRKIPVVASNGAATWIAEEGAFVEADDAFTQITLGAHKVGTIIKVSEELINDSAFDVEGYITNEFARRVGRAEETAFLTGAGANSNQPLGLTAASGGAGTGLTAASATAITADEIIDLVFSLREVYRKNASYIMADSTVKLLRKLKGGDGQYLWAPGLVAGQPDTLYGHAVHTSMDMPAATAGLKPILFGDYKHYWISDRQGRHFQRLNELYAANGQVGFRAWQRLDGKLTLAEAVKVLVMHA